MSSLATGVLLAFLMAGSAEGAPGDATAALVEDAIPGGGINPGAGNSSPSSLTDVGGTVFLSATDGTNGTELWKATIEGPPPPGTPPSIQIPPAGNASPQATGRRAAALKKCKRKKTAKARKKCRAKAGKLPV